MNYWLAQFVLAARKSKEDNGWIQILVFVIMAVFYAVGSIISKAKKTAPMGKEQPPGKPVRKPPDLTIDLKMLKQIFGLPEEPESGSQSGSEESEPQTAKPQVTKPPSQPAGRKVVRPQPAAGRKTPITVKPQAATPQVQMKLEKVPGLTGEAELSTEIPHPAYLSEILSDYENPESLRRAILHYEILGKPISLREPSEHTLEF